jgi:hypothetical protein
MAAGFAVTISARDEISKSLAKINSGLQQLGQVARGVNAEAGKGIVDIFSKVERQAVSTTRRLGEMLTPLRGLTAAASLGGLAALVDRWANLGAGVSRTAVSVGETTRELQRWQGAGQYAGIATDVMSQSLGNLNRSIHDAAYGLGGSQGMIFYAAKFGIALRNSDGSIRSTSAVMHDLGDAVARLRDPDSQLRLAEAFNVGDLLPLLREGGAAMDKFADEAEKSGAVMTKEQIEKAKELHHSYVRLGQAGAAAGYLIATHLEPHVKRLADWLSQPANRDWIGAKIEHFFQAIESFDFSRVERVIDKLGALGKMLGLGDESASGGGSGIGGILGWAGAGALAGWKVGGPWGAVAGAVGGGVAGAARGGYGVPAKPWHNPHYPGGAPGPASELPSSVYDAIARSEGTMGKGGIDYNMLQGGGHADLTNMSLAEVMALQHGETPAVGGFMMQHGTLSDAATALGMDPNTTKFSPEVQRKLAARIHQTQGLGAWSGLKNHPEEMANAVAGMSAGFSGGKVDLTKVNPTLVESLKAAVARLPAGLRAIATSGARVGGLGGSQHHGGNALDLQLVGPDGNRIPNRGADTTGNYGLLGRLYYDEMQKRGLASKAGWGGNFETSPGSGVADLMHYDLGGDRGRYGSLGEEYHRLGTKGAAAPMQMADASGGAGAGDSEHNVTVSFVNAPPGMKSGLTSARGDAGFSLRTEHAMATP